MPKKKKHSPQRKGGAAASLQSRQLPAPSPRILEEVREAERLIERKRWAQARELLEELDERYPNRPEVLLFLPAVYDHLGDMLSYEGACARLQKLIPDDADLTLAVAGANLTNDRPALALRMLRRFLDRWPDHEEAPGARKLMAELEAGMDEILAEIGLEGEKGLEIAALNDEVRALLQHGRYPEAREVAERLLRQDPHFAPALNNVSLTYFIEGQLDQAISTARRVLAFDAENAHALSNLTRYLCMRGRVEEARQWAERLKALEPRHWDAWTKRAEALICLGDDRGVLDALAGAERGGDLLPSTETALLYHLAGVAAMRTGEENLARRYWRESLKLAPGMDLPRGNLEDLRRPIGERHAPWPYTLPYWIPTDRIREMAMELQAALDHHGEEAVERATRRHARRHPELLAMVPLLLEMGDPQGRAFALQLAMAARTPELLAALREFALGQRGPDEMRFEAAQDCLKEGLIAAGPIRFWSEGEWREILMLGFEVYEGGDGHPNPEVERLSGEVVSALREGNGKEAERFVRQALAIEPDAPSLLNNLAAAYEHQGRRDEARNLLEEIHARYPDYFFARTSLAQLHAIRGEVEEARALLDPLLQQRRLHYSELASLSQAEMELALARKDRSSALIWLDMWEGVTPDHPGLIRWRQRLGHPRRRDGRQ